MPTQKSNTYLGCDLDERPIYLSWYGGWYPSLLICGPPGSWKTLGVLRSMIETLLADGWHCIWVTITPDFAGIQYANANSLDIQTLKEHHYKWFFREAAWHTFGINPNRITLLLSPFWRGSIEQMEREYGLPAMRWQIPVENVMLEALQDFYGAGSMDDTMYFKQLREAWEDLRTRKMTKESFITELEVRIKGLPALSQEWAKLFVSKIGQWFEMPEDPILTTHNILDKLLRKKGHLTIFYLPQEEIGNIECATLATFIYTVMDTSAKIHHEEGTDFLLGLDDVGTYTGSSRMTQALESLIQRKGRKCAIFRVIIAQTEDDLKPKGTIHDTKKKPVFDFRINTTISPSEIDGTVVKRGSTAFLYLRKQTFTRHGPKKYRPILFSIRPPLTSYQIFRPVKPQRSVTSPVSNRA